MQDGDTQPSFEWFRCGGGSGEPASSSAERSIRPGTTVPAVVVVSDVGDGSLLLEAWRGGPSAYLSPADAVPLKRQLAVAFGGPNRAISEPYHNCLSDGSRESARWS